MTKRALNARDTLLTVTLPSIAVKILAMGLRFALGVFCRLRKYA